MASSLIRINEATTTELQQLKGIGPKRALHIEQFRQSVSPIRNTMDLCAATGISLKAADALTNEITWDAIDPLQMNTGPVVLTTIVAICLIYTGFDEITQAPFVAPASVYNLSLALILLGGLAAAGDIVMAAVRRIPSGSTWIFPASIAMSLTGFFMIACMAISAQIIDYPPSLNATLTASARLIAFAFVMSWLMYAPILALRLFLNDLPRLNQIGAAYDFGLSVVLISCAVMIVWANSPDIWLEEIFGLWCLVIALIGGSELKSGRSAFVQMLSQQDQSRLRFAMTRSSHTQLSTWLGSTDHRFRVFAAYLVFVACALVGIALGQVLLDL